MYVKELICKFAHRFQITHLLKDHVGWIVVQTEVVTGNVVEHSSPDDRAMSQILSARPFVAGERHRAVLDPNFDPAFFCVLNDWLPCFQESRPVFVNGFGPISTDERIHALQAQHRRCGDDRFDLLDGCLGFGCVAR